MFIAMGDGERFLILQMIVPATHNAKADILLVLSN